ncbi:MAG: fluoride efflux transporter CrcB [Acidimicrobiales bacterium]
MLIAVVVGLAGALGAALRYGVDATVVRRPGRIPVATLTVNVAGSFVLGVLTGLAMYHGLGHTARVVGGTGLCGGLTTWSTAAWETVALAEDGAWPAAVGNIVGGLATSVLAAALGVAIAS